MSRPLHKNELDFHLGELGYENHPDLAVFRSSSEKNAGKDYVGNGAMGFLYWLMDPVKNGYFRSPKTQKITKKYETTTKSNEEVTKALQRLEDRIMFLESRQNFSNSSSKSYEPSQPIHNPFIENSY